MQRLFKEYNLGKARLANRFVFPPIKLGYGSPDGSVTDRQLRFYKRIARQGPAIIILEPVSVTPDGREHPKQPCIHLPGSVDELKKVVDVIHAADRLACLHLNHAGAAANPKAAGSHPKAPSAVTCPRSELTADPLNAEEILAIIDGYRSAANSAVAAGFDLIEVQAGHGYLISQFLNSKINRRDDPYGEDRLRFARKAIDAVKTGAPDLPLVMRISGNEMSPDYGISPDELLPWIQWAGQNGIGALHVGMGSACFSPPWYFHHGSLPEKPQTDALAWLRRNTSLPLIVAGRMGRKERIQEVMDQGLADLIALGRPLIADPDLVAKWQAAKYDDVMYCGYCLQGCLHRLKNAEPLGCNLNPEIGLPPLEPSPYPKSVLVAGGGPAGISAALQLARRGHRVTLAEKSDHLGGQFDLAWQAPGKNHMRQGLESMARRVKDAGAVLLEQEVDAAFVENLKPDLLVWAVGAVQNIPEIPGLDQQYALTALEYFGGSREVHGPRVLVIGAGRSGLEIAEKLGIQGYEVVATKRTDPIGSMMEMITRKLTLMRIEKMSNVTLMPRTTVKEFLSDRVDIESDGTGMSLEPFQTVVLASGMVSEREPDADIRRCVSEVEIIGDARNVMDVFTAVQAGYQIAKSY
jgi:2,4-dienoyl-CoA reductase-like NADH-dependent reductase (Old Yellow Enzyme family)/thioredoxin reductase